MKQPKVMQGLWPPHRPRRGAMIAAGAGVVLIVLAAGYVTRTASVQKVENAAAKPAQRNGKIFQPSLEQWGTLTVMPVGQLVFRAEAITEGKIAVDEDRATPIYSPYSGRVTKILVRAGDVVERGQVLFVIEATDTVQAQNDFIAAMAALNKARSQANLAEIVEKRHRELYEGKAIALKEWQSAQADLISAQSDLRSAETGLEAARNRLRILGRSDEEIETLAQKGAISPETPILAPIGGTIVQRKVGPGQYVSSGSTEPAFVIGDLSTVWLVAFVREPEATKIGIGQAMRFSVLAYPNEIFTANITHVATALDPSTRRLMVRATIKNMQGQFKPEMLASVRILTDEGELAPAIPREAVIYEPGTTSIWVVLDDHTVELRQIRLGLTNGSQVQVLDGLKRGDKIITNGPLLIGHTTASG